MDVSNSGADARRGNTALMRKLLIVTCVMFGFGFAMVPFYKKLCEVTGLTNLAGADEVSNSQVDSTRTVTMQFDTNLRNDLPWTFKPVERSVTFHPGELVRVDFEVRNQSDRVITGQAIPSWGPQVAGRHMKKLDCFCFRQQTLQPGEVRTMPVVFVLEKSLPDEVNFVTMSYTFFQVEGRAEGSSFNASQVKVGAEGSSFNASQVKVRAESSSFSASHVKVGAESSSFNASQVKVGAESSSFNRSQVKVGAESSSFNGSQVKVGAEGSSFNRSQIKVGAESSSFNRSSLKRSELEVRSENGPAALAWRNG